MPITKFADKLKSAGQEVKLPNKRLYTTNDDVSPFLDQPSGSSWGLKQLERLRIWEEWECDKKSLFTKKSKLEKSGAIVRYLQDQLCLPWDQVTGGKHKDGSFYGRLSALASWVEPTRVHQPEFVLPSSSPARSGDSGEEPEPEEESEDSEDSEEPEDSEVIDTPRSKRPAKSISEPSPSASRRFRLSLSTSSFPDKAEVFQPTSSLPDKDEAFQPTSSMPIAPSSEVAEMTSKPRLEKDVEFAISAFMSLIGDAFESTEAGITDVEAQEQGLHSSTV